ncbi:MAG: hypothetical protein LBC20_00090 [Planctomycetaceae bacterium]|jgi:hypothetical protein|nr:hypothetical protein [Planctomycetaceae bacterium]
MENVLKCLVVFLGNFLVKIPMLKWIVQEKQGGGGGSIEGSFHVQNALLKTSLNFFEPLHSASRWSNFLW